MGRGDSSAPFNQQRDPSVGPKGYRTEDDPIDDRPLLAQSQFWESEEERKAYERSVAEIQPNRRWRIPKLAADESKGEARRVAGDTWLGMGELCIEIARLAEGLNPRRRPRSFPRGLSQREWERRQNDAKMRAAGDVE